MKRPLFFRWLRPLLLSALLLGSQAVALTNVDVLRLIEAWYFACSWAGEHYSATCDITPPDVVFQPMERFWGLYWPGSDTIYINSLMPKAYWPGVAVHEMIHYILDTEGLEEDFCAHEEAAHRAQSEFNKVTYDPSWRLRDYYAERGCNVEDSG